MSRFLPRAFLSAFALALLVAAILLATSLASPSAFGAGTTTGIVRAHSNLDVYTWTPTETGYLRITIGWTDPDGNPVGGFPEAEVGVCVQACDGLEPYAVVNTPQLMMTGLNPSATTIPVPSYSVGWPYFFSVVPSVAETRYHLTVDFRKTPVGSYTRVVDATGYAHPTNGELRLPATATAWHDVIHHWPGSTGDLYANWNDYVGTRDGLKTLVSDWSVQWKPPVVSNASTSGLTDKWLSVDPYIWNGAVRPNVWFDPSYDTWPRPGSLALTDAPAWYTWAYSDSALTTSAPCYSFGSTITPAASGCSLSFAPEAGATVSYTFVGDTLSWLYAAGPLGGTATLSVEPPFGGEGPTRVVEVDQYAESMQYGRRLDLTGLGAGAHTVVVESEAGLYHDAFLAPTDVADVHPLAEDHSDGTTRYAWARTVLGGVSGGACSYCAVRDAATAFTFSGTSVTWKFVRSRDGGIACVWIDGVAKAPVDQYGGRPRRRGAPLPASVTYSGLGAGMHTILIVNSGDRNAASSGTVVSSDAFVVDGVTFEE